MKRRIFIVEFFVILSLLLFVAGCTAIIGGKSFDYSSVPKIEKGKSTQQDIQKIFGEPLSVRKTETGEVWSYHVSEVGPVFNPTRSLDVYFDKSGTVVDYTYKEQKKIF
jgi:outer membrane protein assembly factor BamE (lipoprotein component of BamABCDE complex)